MSISLSKTIWLKKRYGMSAFPAIGINLLLIPSFFKSAYMFGNYRTFDLIAYWSIVFILFNVIPILSLLDVYLYRVGFFEKGVRSSSFSGGGPLMTMEYSDIEIVDLKPASEVKNSKRVNLNPSVIVLYRKGWDGEELFTLDPRRTNLHQFKGLVRLINDKCPGRFSEDAQRYLNRPDLITPRENAEGHLMW